MIPGLTPVPPEKLCDAKLRNKDQRCKQPAGHMTDHPGEGRCKWHGGKSPIFSGRYSHIYREKLSRVITRHEADPDPLNMLSELAAARALFEDFINRYDEWREAILAWYYSWQAASQPASEVELKSLSNLLDEFEAVVPERTAWQDLVVATVKSLHERLGKPKDSPRPREILDISSAYAMLETITKIVERIEKIRAANAISRPDLLRIMAEMGRVVDVYVKDEDTREKIMENWLAIRVA